MGAIKTLITFERRTQNGELIERREQESRSWLKHLWDLAYLPFSYQQLLLINDIGGVARTLGFPGSSLNPHCNLQINGPSGGGTVIGIVGQTAVYSTPLASENMGIVVGTSNAAVVATQDALTTKVAHGEGAGTLLYGGTEVYGLTFANPNGSFKIRRYFTNVLGGNVTIQEVGIYSPGYKNNAEVNLFCIARDVCGAIVVANTEILEVTYTVQITV